jgi:hypothetical protein
MFSDWPISLKPGASFVLLVRYALTHHLVTMIWKISTSTRKEDYTQ